MAWSLPFFLLLALTSSVEAQVGVSIFVWTRDAQYQPGGNGVLYVTVKNDGPTAITIHNITITFPWFSYIKDHWEGNMTIKNINAPVANKGGVWNTEIQFTVPKDGRALGVGFGSMAQVVIGTDKGFITGSGGIGLAPAVSTPSTDLMILYLIITVIGSTAANLVFMYWFIVRRSPIKIGSTPSMRKEEPTSWEA